MKSVLLEIVAPIFEGLGICSTCELILGEAGVGEHPASRGLDEYPQDWQEDYRRLTEWVHELAGRYGDKLFIRIVDPQSPQGLLKSLRYRVRRYPTFVVQGRKKIVGWQRAELDSALAAAIGDEGA